jgi:hypothetical protein
VFLHKGHLAVCQAIAIRESNNVPNKYLIEIIYISMNNLYFFIVMKISINFINKKLIEIYVDIQGRNDNFVILAKLIKRMMKYGSRMPSAKRNHLSSSNPTTEIKCPHPKKTSGYASHKLYEANRCTARMNTWHYF